MFYPKTYTIRNRAFTLIEVLVAMAVFALVIWGILRLFFSSYSLAERSRQISSAFSQTETLVEKIRVHPYGQIVADFSSGGAQGDVFPATGLAGNSSVFIDNSQADRLRVDVVTCWRDEFNGHVIGEDQNLNGRLDGGEDKNGNGRLDSLVSLTTLISNKGM